MNPLRTLARLALALVIGLVAGACGSSESDAQTVYRDPNDRSLFELPAEWNLYGPDDMSQIESPLLVQFGGSLPVVQGVGFDSAPGPNVANLATDLRASPYPIGAQLIRSIGTSERDSVSRRLLETATFAYQEGSGAREVIQEDFSFGSDYEGIRRLIGITDETGGTEGILYFISVTDPADSLIYSMAAGCSFTCWEEYQTQITEVVDSWLVNTNP